MNRRPGDRGVGRDEQQPLRQHLRRLRCSPGSFIIWILIGLVGALLSWGPLSEQINRGAQISYSALLEHLEDGNAQRVNVGGQQIKGQLKEPAHRITEADDKDKYERFVPHLPLIGDDELFSVLRSQGVDGETVPESDFPWGSLIVKLLPLLLLAGFVYFVFSHTEATRSTRRAVLIVVTVAAVVRLIPNFLLPMGAGYDIESYGIVGDLVLEGQDVYGSAQAAHRHPYLPLQMYWMALARWGSLVTSASFVRIVRLAPIGADVAIAVVLFLALQRGGSTQRGLRGGLLYALNPVPVFVSAYHGQFDSIPALFLLAAVTTWRQSALASGGWLGLGILSKSWPVLALPSLWTGIRDWRKKAVFLLGTAAVPLAGIGLYLVAFPGQPRVALSRALGYNWGVGVWGYSYFFRLASVLKPELTEPFHWLVRNGRYVTLAVLGMVWVVRARREAPAAGILTVLVAFFAATHAFSIQYLMWIVPFAVLADDHRWLARYTLAAFAYMFLAYMTLILEMHVTNLLPWPEADWFLIMPAGLPAWLVTVGWTAQRLLGTSAGEP